MSILKACSKCLLLAFLLIAYATAFSQKSSEKFIGTWYCIMIDCPNQLTRFETLADNSLKVYRTFVFEKPNFYHISVGDDFFPRNLESGRRLANIDKYLKWEDTEIYLQ